MERKQTPHVTGRADIVDHIVPATAIPYDIVPLRIVKIAGAQQNIQRIRDEKRPKSRIPTLRIGIGYIFSAYFWKLNRANALVVGSFKDKYIYNLVFGLWRTVYFIKIEVKTDPVAGHAPRGQCLEYELTAHDMGTVGVECSK